MQTLRHSLDVSLLLMLTWRLPPKQKPDKEVALEHAETQGGTIQGPGLTAQMSPTGHRRGMLSVRTPSHV